MFRVQGSGVEGSRVSGLEFAVETQRDNQHCEQKLLPKSNVPDRQRHSVNRVLWEHPPRQLTAEDQQVDLR